MSKLFNAEPVEERPAIPEWRSDPIFIGCADIIRPGDVVGTVITEDGIEVTQAAEWGEGDYYLDVFIAGVPIEQATNLKLTKTDAELLQASEELHERVSKTLASGAISSAFRGKVPKMARSPEL